MKKQQAQEIAQRYCSHVDANVVLAKINDNADEPPQYRCLSSHLCGAQAGQSCKNHPSQNGGLQ